MQSYFSGVCKINSVSVPSLNFSLQYLSFRQIPVPVWSLAYAAQSVALFFWISAIISACGHSRTYVSLVFGTWHDCMVCGMRSVHPLVFD